MANRSSHGLVIEGSSRCRIPQIVSYSGMETRPVISAVETQVMKLIEDLRSSCIDTQREATARLLVLSRDDTENRMVIGSSGAIALLVNLLHSPDTKTQENSATCVCNLSMNQNNKRVIVDAGAIEPLIYVLETGSAEAKESSAATINRLSNIDEYNVRFGRSGAIVPLVELLKNGTPNGKKDAVAALFILSQKGENKVEIVKAGTVELLVALMDPGSGMEDKAIAVLLASLATFADGWVAIAQAGGIAALVEVVELGSPKGKEYAVETLCHLCSNSSEYCNMVLKEDVMPALKGLWNSGTPKAKKEVQKILEHLRNYQHSIGTGMQ